MHSQQSDYTPEEIQLLRNYVTNLDGQVYAIANLPEEVIAVIFAYVSRSPKSFRRNLLDLLKGDEKEYVALANAAMQPTTDESESNQPSGLAYASEKARKFHEKWVVGYGHSSVAEHAVVHLGVEGISRLASSLLELANRFLSFTEYSQRYQRPQMGAYHTPEELFEHPELLNRYSKLQERCFHAYEKAQQVLYNHLIQTLPRGENETDRQFNNRAEKLSFEDARYLLSLAVHTNLGMTANGRALRDAIVRLYATPYSETRRLADQLKHETSALLPALLRYAEPNAYQLEVNRRFADIAQSFGLNEPNVISADRPAFAEVRLLQSDPEGLDRLVVHCLYGFANVDKQRLTDQTVRLSGEEKLSLLREWVTNLGTHDPYPDGFRHVRYQFEMLISEANWHQLLRHCRGINFTEQHPGVHGGITIPPRAIEAGLTELFVETAEECRPRSGLDE